MTPVSSANRTSRTAPLAHVVWTQTRVVASQTKQRPPRRPSRRRCARRRLPPPSRARTPPSPARHGGRPRLDSPGRGSSRRSRRRPPGARRRRGFPRSPPSRTSSPRRRSGRRLCPSRRRRQARHCRAGWCLRGAARDGRLGDDLDRRGGRHEEPHLQVPDVKDAAGDGRLADGALLWRSSRVLHFQFSCFLFIRKGSF